MKLVVPYVDELSPADSRLIKLAEFLGIVCAPVPARTRSGESRWDFHTDPSIGDDDCLAINPDVIRNLQGSASIQQLVFSLISRFPCLLVHSVRSDSFHDSLLAALTSERCQASKGIPGAAGTLTISADAADICHAFAGMSIAVQSLSDDRVFPVKAKSGWRSLIEFGEDSLFAIFKGDDRDVFLLGSGDIVDLDSEAGDTWLAESFTKFLPYAMALRYIFREQSWQPVQNYASLVVDDPLLRPNYGFLNYRRVMRLMEEHDFKTTIAFIPHNFRRSSARIARLFLQDGSRFSICFHGNDHTNAEFADRDPARLNSLLRIAQKRIDAHKAKTGVSCDLVMVFPQGKFSVEAMAALRSHNFDAAVNTTIRPIGENSQLTIRDLAQPAVLRYAGFPLFLRKYSTDTQDLDIAFKLFFGIPIIVVEHHDAFANPETLIKAVGRINRIAPSIRWSGVSEAVRGSILRRQVSNNVVQVRAFARNVYVENSSSAPQMFRIEWLYPGSKQSLSGVLRTDQLSAEYTVDDCSVCAEVTIDGGKSEVLSIREVPVGSSVRTFGLRHTMLAFCRRRLSEIRDNYISKSPALLAAAKSLRRSFQLLI